MSCVLSVSVLLSSVDGILMGRTLGGNNRLTIFYLIKFIVKLLPTFVHKFLELFVSSTARSVGGKLRVIFLGYSPRISL